MLTIIFPFAHICNLRKKLLSLQVDTKEKEMS